MPGYSDRPLSSGGVSDLTGVGLGFLGGSGVTNTGSSTGSGGGGPVVGTGAGLQFNMASNSQYLTLRSVGGM